jgi:Tol biopolymer transport system component
MKRGTARITATRLACGIAVGGLLLWLLATPALAGFGPIELQSVGQFGYGEFEQFEEAGEPAISEDGQYLAFKGTLGLVSGIWRKDLQTGALELVASSGSDPSISADGRYVSFTAPDELVKDAKTGGNVYVRDMDIESSGASCTNEEETQGKCPYELASALNDSVEGLTYYEGGGAEASGRVSLSADGREVAFVIGGTSNLTSEPGGSTPGIPTPGGQVVVRYLDSHETVLVSSEREADNGQMTGRPVIGGAVTGLGVALSGDGSAVAWLGANIPEQAPTLSGERQQIENDDQEPDQHYDEPLWRRIADGQGAPTRRMVGGGDPLAPGCPSDGTIEIPACQGPYPKLAWESTRGGDESNYGWIGIPGYDGVPQLSYDGWTAAVIGDPDSTSNVFVVNMDEGLNRVQALRQLTREVPVSETVNPGFLPQYVAGAGDIYDVGISPDGSRIAFTTQRQQFPLAPPNYTETPPVQIGVVELYQIDLSDESLVRVTHGPDDGPSFEAGGLVTVTSKGAVTPSYSKNDLTLAFADTASNLVFGDANGASDVFTATENEVSGAEGPVQVGPAPPNQEPTVSQWRLSVVPVVHSNGEVTLDIEVPGAGELSAHASATVPVTTKILSRADRRGGRSRPGRRVQLKTRVVASARMSTALACLLELPLRVAPSYMGLLSTKAGIYATVHVSFTGYGGPALSQAVVVSLRRIEKKGKSGESRKKIGTKTKVGSKRKQGRV